VGLSDDLQSEDDATRLAACNRAASEGGLEHVPQLLDLALYDLAEVKFAGGMAEDWRSVSAAASGALAAILERLGETESAARAVGTDLRHDDEAVGSLLYYLGAPAEAVRRELETHPEPRVRLRALKAVLTTERTPELVRRMLADPSPLVRVEATRSIAAGDEYPRALTDAAPAVRLEVARQLRAGARHTEGILQALERERDPDVRHALVQCLPSRWREGGDAITVALRRALDEPRADTRRVAAETLKRAGEAHVGQAIVARLPVESDRHALYALLSYEHLAHYGKAVLPFVASLFLETRDGLLRSAALHALVRFGWCDLPRVLPLATHEDEETRRAALFLLGSQPSTTTLAQVKALRSNSEPVRRGLETLVLQLAAQLQKGAVPGLRRRDGSDSDRLRDLS